MSVPRFDLIIEQGSDFTDTLNWYGGGKAMKPIEDICVGYPTRIKVTAHGLPTVSDTPVIISGVDGCEILNSTGTGIEEAIYIDVDHFDMPVSTVKDIWEVGSGEITWHRPTDIVDWTARMQIRQKWQDTDFIYELTTENDGIVLDDNDASIQLFIPASTTMDFGFVTAWYDVEMISPTGETVRVFSGKITLTREMTR
jgi:hypothetical protein